MSKHLVLFDMDGTLTPARKKMTDDVADALSKLVKTAEVGVVTGSDIDYMKEQMPQVFDRLDLSTCKLLPCNGTKVYQIKELSYTQVYSNDMAKYLGKEVVAAIMAALFDLQRCLVKEKGLEIPLTGNFIEMRGSMINWCPIGRSANQEEREKFKALDHEIKLRERFLARLDKRLKKIDGRITSVLGGNTSFDIYPTGWDKTYALQHFNEPTIWFVGDRCTGNGNDRAIYEAVLYYSRAYEVRDPEHTIEIIEEIIRRIENERDD